MTDTTRNGLGITSREETAFPRFGQFVSRFMMHLRQQSGLRRDRRRLQMMPDHILKDLGISRAEIDYLPADTELQDRLHRSN